ncbi:MAG: DegT/DnrJ/EryC1/StrS family aminotransferase, partial [Candidatus Omnitrophica bacterium]|nr:DegT/DnrJ/EryC1/StrS family aminotransferase [Candidatus Omnitrophota bacterium]
CHQILGFNYRMTEVEAAIGMIQLQKLNGFIQQRKKIGARFAKGFAGAGDIAIQKTTPGCDPSFNYFSIALKKNAVKISRDELVQELRKEGIPCAVHYPIPLHEQPCFAHYRRGAVPVSEALARNILSLPMHPYLTEPDVDFVVEKVLQLVGKYATK